jgi:ABC-type nitrate/sulfonate/bicarbonate transport system permease component
MRLTEPDQERSGRLDGRRWLLPASLGAGLLLIWESLSALGLANPFFLPPPSTLAQTLGELIFTGFPEDILLDSHVTVTLRRSLTGYLIAVGLAIPLGIVIGTFPVLDALSRHLIALGRSIAPISILPIFIALFGIGETSKIALIAFACFWATITNTIAGVKYVDPLLLRAASSMDTTRLGIFVGVVLPAALPRIFSGLKVSLAIAFMVIVAAEMFATVYGLGSLINEARTWFRTDITIVGMAVIGAIGFTASLSLDWIERRLMPWSNAARREE